MTTGSPRREAEETILKLACALNEKPILSVVRLVDVTSEGALSFSVGAAPEQQVDIGSARLTTSQVRSRIQEILYNASPDAWIDAPGVQTYRVRTSVLPRAGSSTCDFLFIRAAYGHFKSFQYFVILTQDRIDLKRNGSALRDIMLHMLGNAAHAFHTFVDDRTDSMMSAAGMTRTLSRLLLSDKVRVWKKTLNANLFEGISPRGDLPSDFVIADQVIARLQAASGGIALGAKQALGLPPSFLLQLGRTQRTQAVLIPVFATEGLIGLMVAMYPIDLVTVVELRDRIRLAQFECRTRFRDRFHIVAKTTVEEQFVRLAPMVSTGLSANLLIHDLNALLGNINFGLQKVAKHFVGDEIHGDIKSIAEQVNECIATVQTVSRMSTGRVFDKRRINLVGTIAAALSVHGRRRKDLGCSLRFKEDAVFNVVADKASIEQVFSNIISNALYFLAEEGDSAGAQRTWTPNLDIQLYRHGGYVRVDIIDNGPGIARDDLERVFEYYYTSKGARGTGLGLSISKLIVESHNGAIRALERATGAHIRIDLPSAD